MRSKITPIYGGDMQQIEKGYQTTQTAAEMQKEVSQTLQNMTTNSDYKLM